ncbi:MAG: Glutamine synthetase [Chlamydiia bacterium]|nr:Glutamine synthetase [Chlamydiia bacterium]
MITARQHALEKVLDHYDDSKSVKPLQPSESFGKYVFNRTVMQKMLPKKIFQNVEEVLDCKKKLNPIYADAIALAMKEWAISHGATHYCHWFQPLTGQAAEKHDSFLDWKGADTVIENFCGHELMRGEPDASSLPSGGLRKTCEARGYTSWDPTTSAFLWKIGESFTLCIPSVFFSWTGDVLDSKIPLMRSDMAINDAAVRLLNLTGINTESVYSTLGCEQEYFLVDRALYNLRPDLMILGKTVYGAPPAKGQELCDHYFGKVKERVIAFMQDFENEAIELGIPVKTRHNEVAPAQHEIAAYYEKASLAVDHNILLMELMKKIATKHDLACLVHEKPFANMNGSGKHHNWSLATAEGLNLLDPTKTPENNIHFLILITAVLKAVHKHAALLRATIGSRANDNRLGGFEAPPAIISVYLGEAIEALLRDIEKGGAHKTPALEKVDLGLQAILEMPIDNTDRNRTSPFAFTGNKFELRSVGSSQSPAFPVTVINAIIAKALNDILDQIDSLAKGKALTKEGLLSFILPVLKKELKASKNIRFSGDNYSDAWKEEAKKRGLPNIENSYFAYDEFTKKSTHAVFEGILNKNELDSRHLIMQETYFSEMMIEAKLMCNLFYVSILPGAINYQNDIATSLEKLQSVGIKTSSKQKAFLKKFSSLIEDAMHGIEALESLRANEKNAMTHDIVALHTSMRSAREQVDLIEKFIHEKHWPFPSYQELLFVL